MTFFDIQPNLHFEKTKPYITLTYVRYKKGVKS
jgi:hypothetical protein